MADNFVYDYDTSIPADGDKPKFGAAHIRNSKDAIAERFAVDHVMVAADNYDTVDTGHHKWLVFYAARNLVDALDADDEHLAELPVLQGTACAVYPEVKRYDTYAEDGETVNGTVDYIELIFIDEQGRNIQITEKGRLKLHVDDETIEYDDVKGLRAIQPKMLEQADYTFCSVFPETSGVPVVLSGTYPGNGTSQDIALVPDGYELVSLEIKEQGTTQKPVFFRGGVCYHPNGKLYIDINKTEGPVYFKEGYNNQVITLDSTREADIKHVNDAVRSYYFMAICVQKGS